MENRKEDGTLRPELMPKRVLTYREREAINRRISTELEILNAGNEPQGVGMPTPISRDKLRRAQLDGQTKAALETLERESPPSLSGKDRDAVAKRAKELEEKLKASNDFETWAEIQAKDRSDPNYRTALDKGRRRSMPGNQTEKYIQELKNCRITLEPENPYADDISDLRRQR